MKFILCAVVLFSCLQAATVWEWGEYARRYVPNDAWGPGERLVFNVQYGIMKAGTASLSVTGPEDVNGLLAYRITAEARSNPVFDSFFAVRDVNRSHLDIVQLHTLRYFKDLREGDYSRSEETLFYQEEGVARYPGETDPEKMEDPIPPHALDVLGAFYYARTLSFELGDRFSMDVHVDNDNYPLWVNVLERNSIRTPAGTFQCLLLKPELRGDGIFKQEGEIFIWVTDDSRHMPVLMTASMVIGEISCLLDSYTPGTVLEVENPFLQE